MPHTTPQRVARTSTRVCLTASTATLSIAAAWGAQMWAGRPFLTLMAFGIALGVAVVAGVAAVTARCHLSTAQAFAAGAVTARQAPGPPPHMRTRPLKVVD